MSSSEEDSYSMIFTSLKHPIRRKILRVLSYEPQTFSDLQKQFKIESSHLTYHIDGLGNLIYKTEDGKYALSSLGEAAVSMMRNVEEPPTNSHFAFDHARSNVSEEKVVRNKGLVIFGTILLAIGLFASFYQVTQLVGQPPFVVAYQVVTPYQSVGIVLDVAGIIFLALGLVYLSRKTLPPPLNNPRRALALGLGILCVVLVIALIGTVSLYTSQISSLNSKVSDLTEIVNLEKSTLWINDTTVTQTANNYTSWVFSASYAGFIEVFVQSSTTNSTYVRVIYSTYEINYDNTIDVGTSGWATFPVALPYGPMYTGPVPFLPSSNIEIRVGNTNTVGNATETVGYVTYNY